MDRFCEDVPPTDSFVAFATLVARDFSHRETSKERTLRATRESSGCGRHQNSVSRFIRWDQNEHGSLLTLRESRCLGNFCRNFERAEDTRRISRSFGDCDPDVTGRREFHIRNFISRSRDTRDINRCTRTGTPRRRKQKKTTSCVYARVT